VIFDWQNFYAKFCKYRSLSFKVEMRGTHRQQSDCICQGKEECYGEKNVYSPLHTWIWKWIYSLDTICHQHLHQYLPQSCLRYVRDVYSNPLNNKSRKKHKQMKFHNSQKHWCFTELVIVLCC